MTRRISIDPITRLEGHGKIHALFNDAGDVKKVFLQVPDFKGFERFCVGRAVEEMPTLTQKICGVCPMAHHTASSKALDRLFDVEPPQAAKKIRELAYSAFIYEDHLLHFYYLGGPDLVLGSRAPVSERNIFGTLKRLGTELGRRLISIRKRIRDMNGAITGSALYPVHGLPGGVSKGITRDQQLEIQDLSEDAIEFAVSTLGFFSDTALEDRTYREMMHSEVFSLETYYMGLVDQDNRVNFYDGTLRVVNPQGDEFIQFDAGMYQDHLEEHVEPWTYQKFLYLKEIGWKGFTEGETSGVYRVGPLARLNSSEGMATPLAQAEYEKMMSAFGKKPVHNTLAYHWARLIEVLYAAERMKELAHDHEITSSSTRNLPHRSPTEGVGVCEAPRGTLLHHYITDDKGFVTFLNLLVATQNSTAAINMSVEKAARALGKTGDGVEADLNLMEMAFRAYDPCMACATH